MANNTIAFVGERDSDTAFIACFCRSPMKMEGFTVT